MNAAGTRIAPCIYVTACRDCEGIPEAVAVRLLSGDQIEIQHVVDVHVTDEEIVFRTAEGPARTFRRDKVYYAGCSRCLPPFLS
jgi:hypothetical protein